jgi:hypothetical protein
MAGWLSIAQLTRRPTTRGACVTNALRHRSLAHTQLPLSLPWMVLRFYGDAIPGHVLNDRVSSYVHMFNLYWAFRCACGLACTRPLAISIRHKLLVPLSLSLSLSHTHTHTHMHTSYFLSPTPLSHTALSPRPYGATVLLATYDQSGPMLHMVDPSGTSYRYFGAAVGKGRQLARNEIEKLKLSEMTCR